MINNYYQVDKSQIIFSFLKASNYIFNFAVKLIGILMFINYTFTQQYSIYA